MKKLLFLLVLVNLLACSKTENTNEQFYGTWKDEFSYNGVAEVNGVIDSVSYPNIIYKFLDNGRYETIDEVPWGIKVNGEWDYDESSETITFVPDTSMYGDLGFKKSYKWDVISVNDQTLEVMFKYWGTSSEVGADTLQFQFYRKFVKQ